MTREIGFRLWCKNHNEWERNDWHIESNGLVVDEKYGISLRPDTHILMQYTGLKDKNGAEIYEGDIITLCTYSYHEPLRDYTGEVIFGICGVGILTREGNREICNWINDITRDIFTYEIHHLGNIYENPDLLKEATNG